MKKIIFLYIALYALCFNANAQLFGSKTKYTDDLKFYPKYRVETPLGKSKLIGIKDISLPTVKKIFPGVKMREIESEGDIPLVGGISRGKRYYPYFKGKYYRETNELSFSESKKYHLKTDTTTLKERVAAYTTLACYEKLLGEVTVDSISLWLTSIDGQRSYFYYFHINNANYNGGFVINEKGWISHIYVVQINRGGNFATPETKEKSSSYNFINTDTPENYNGESHYYFKVENNSADVQIVIPGLDPNEIVQCLFVDYLYQSTVYETKNLIADLNGEAYYHYFQDPIPTEKDVEENDIDLAKMNKLLLQKVEELTLYILEQQEQINQLKNK